MRRLRVGVAGAGNVAETVHLPAYSKLADRVELVALCDRDEGRAAVLGARFGMKRVFPSLEAMLASGGLDAVSICLPNNLHAPAALAALGAGLHVLCEKPPALNAAEAGAMELASQTAGRVLAYGFHWRFTNEAESAKALIDSGELGAIYSGRVQALRRRGIPGWGSFTDKAVQGGGPLMDIGVHMLDLALYLKGYPEPSLVTAASYAEIGTRKGPGLMGAWDPEKFGVEDSLFGFLRFVDGSSLLLETSFALNMKERSLMKVELFGSKAGIDLFPLELHGEKSGELCDFSFPFRSERDPHQDCVADFVDACLARREPRCGAAEGSALQGIVELLYRSAELGRPLGPEDLA